MRRRNLVIITAAGVIVIVAVAAVVRAQPQVSLDPDHILKGTTPTITITLDKSIKEIKAIRVAGQDVPGPVQQPSAGGKLSLLLPKLDFVGRANLEVVGKDDKTVAVAELTYVESAQPSSTPVLGSTTVLILLFVYVGLIVLLPLIATLYDIRKSYAERGKVFDRLLPNPSTEITALLKNMDQGPTGLVGLTRGLVALTLILVLAFAAFHLIVFTPKVPDVADKLLMLLAGTLTAITGFYFGSKAATEAAAATTASQNQPGSPTPGDGVPKILNVALPLGATANTAITVTGEGFGEPRGKGTVKFGDKAGTVTDWKDKQIAVALPADVKSGDVDVIVTNNKGTASTPYRITIAGPPPASPGAMTKS